MPPSVRDGSQITVGNLPMNCFEMPRLGGGTARIGQVGGTDPGHKRSAILFGCRLFAIRGGLLDVGRVACRRLAVRFGELLSLQANVHRPKRQRRHLLPVDPLVDPYLFAHDRNGKTSEETKTKHQRSHHFFLPASPTVRHIGGRCCRFPAGSHENNNRSRRRRRLSQIKTKRVKSRL